MKSTLLQANGQNSKRAENSIKSDKIRCFFEKVNYDVADRILLVGKIGTMGKKLRMSGAHVTILEEGDYSDICHSLVYNKNCNVVKGKLEYLPFKDNHFDKIILVDQLEGVSNFKKASSEIRRVLKSNGVLIIEDLNFKKFMVKFEYLKDRMFGSQSKFYYPQEIFNMFLELNFDGKLHDVRKNRYVYIGKRI